MSVTEIFASICRGLSFICALVAFALFIKMLILNWKLERDWKKLEEQWEAKDHDRNQL